MDMPTVGMLGESKAAILQHLLRRTATVGDLAGSLKLSQTAIRSQLDGLEKEGFVRARFLRSGRGRPKKVYSLTEAGKEAFPRKYELLLDLLIKRVVEEEGEENATRLLSEAGRRLGDEYRPDTKGLSPLDRANSIVRVLNDLGFAASLSIEEGRPVIVRHNCIWMSAARAHHELVCDVFDSEMMRTLLGEQEVGLSQCIGEGKPTCRNILPLTPA
jgi:predicted ArsR family transcriptional regulator